ncbi:hypothetical protein GLAREA_06873 [Glarea lozoyensis ATCC 20868]|uniref:Isomerase YraM n=1 Tax=Glarea lozoyensis (strain ATCC 20868 / MF5171) TaxID=1116229 RepID=S3D7Z2_GLAL2|nr:uncharacterized protein GLAREA_06873 [Glarea lozoyensis ATCC 20868]EPE33860.1 hypothetical protein GLAREA_06873 [Glarea lozoyensis ATCC 20868]
MAVPSVSRTRHRVRHQLPAVMMRSGTSKGLFLHRKDLPRDQEEWAKVLLSVMGSRYGDKKQIDGIGGATSTTSKVAVVSKSEREDADVDYTFAQVAVGQEKVDFSGNCGNMASGVGPFALDEGLVKVLPGQTEVDIRIYNTNTRKLLIENVQVDDEGHFWEFGDCHIGGVKAAGSEIKVQFVKPAGSMTGELFPTGERSETLAIGNVPPLENMCVQVTLIDAANPFVFVDSRSLPLSYHTEGPAASSSLALVEAIRCAGAVKMGLATDPISAGLIGGTPKIAVVSAPPFDLTGAGPDIKVQSFSMGKPHPTLQLTGAVCLASAISTPGTIPHQLSKLDTVLTPATTPPYEQELHESFFSPEESLFEDKKVKIQHASGNIDAVVRKDILGANVESVSLSRTARRIFSGNVLFDI